MTADHRASAGAIAGQIAASRQQSIRKLVMPADRRAALVRMVCRAICQAENGPCDEPICVAENGCTFWTPHAVAAIDLIRAEVLEEAEAICRDKQRQGKDAQSCAAAIRALKGTS